MYEEWLLCYIDVLEIIFWFSFNVMYLGEKNGKLNETKNVFYSEPFLKMRKFFLDMRKDFLIMSNFYLVEILCEPNSLTIATIKQYSKWAIMCLFWVFLFLIMRIRNLQCRIKQKNQLFDTFINYTLFDYSTYTYHV